jgi:hypothetical protein
MGETAQPIVEQKGVLHRLLNMETHDAYDGLKTAIERSKQGIGTAVFCSHNMKNDMLAAVAMLKSVPEFADKKFVLPMNSMLYKAYWPGEKLMNVTLIPVHSPQVRKKHALARENPKSRELTLTDRITVPKDEYLDVESSLQKYLKASKEALEQGGIVIVAPQAQGNLDKMDLTHPRKAFSKFRDYMAQSPDLTYSVLPIGVSYPKSAKEGRMQKGTHFGEKMRVEIGACYDQKKVTQGVSLAGGNADLWIYGQIASLLPKEAVNRPS